MKPEPETVTLVPGGPVAGVIEMVCASTGRASNHETVRIMVMKTAHKRNKFRLRTDDTMPNALRCSILSPSFRTRLPLSYRLLVSAGIWSIISALTDYLLATRILSNVEENVMRANI